MFRIPPPRVPSGVEETAGPFFFDKDKTLLHTRLDLPNLKGYTKSLEVEKKEEIKEMLAKIPDLILKKGIEKAVAIDEKDMPKHRNKKGDLTRTDNPGRLATVGNNYYYKLKQLYDGLMESPTIPSAPPGQGAATPASNIPERRPTAQLSLSSEEERTSALENDNNTLWFGIDDLTKKNTALHEELSNRNAELKLLKAQQNPRIPGETKQDRLMWLVNEAIKVAREIKNK